MEPPRKPTNECWLWARYCNYKGYGMVKNPVTRKLQLAHRFMYEALVGYISDGLVVDHLCRVRRCVNPEHMELVTNRVNILRGISPTAQNSKLTHCLRGHEFNKENTIKRSDGGRRCRQCTRNQKRVAGNKKYHANIELSRAKQREYYHRNIEAKREYQREYRLTKRGEK